MTLSFLSFLFLQSLFVFQSPQYILLLHANAKSTNNVIPASFVTPKSPSIVSSLLKQDLQSNPPSSIVARENAISTCYGVCPTSTTTSLSAKKRRKGNTSSSTSSTTAKPNNNKRAGSSGKKNATKASSSSPKLKNGKLQVQLLKHIAGTGNAGDIIMVAPAFYEHKLKKTKSAKLITDEEVQERIQIQKLQQEQREMHIQEAKSVLENEMTLLFKKKAGPEGHLFGGIKAKDILSQCKASYPTDKKKEKGGSHLALEGKAVKVLRFLDGEGKDVGHDIKEFGDYSATISLGSDVLAKVAIKVEKE